MQVLKSSVGKRSPETVIWVVVKIRVPFLRTRNIRCRAILGTQKRTIIPLKYSTYRRAETVGGLVCP